MRGDEIMTKNEIKIECQKIARQLERLEDLTSALTTRIIKINKYSELHNHIDEIRKQILDIDAAVDKYEWDIDWKE